MHEKKLTKRDVFMAWLRWHLWAYMCTSTERLQALGVCGALAPSLKKLYGDDKERLSGALVRHMQLFNTQLNWGAVIGGIVLALEEEKANDDAAVPEEVITGLKTGFMGPMAGIGDTMDWLTIQPILLSLFIASAQKGNVAAAIVPMILFACYAVPVGYFLFHLGYRTGRTSIATLLHGSMVRKLITGSSILGLFMMGSLSATMVKVRCGIQFISNGKEFIIQDFIDTIAPGLIPLLIVMGIFLYLEKVGNKYLLALLILFVGGIILGALGILC